MQHLTTPRRWASLLALSLILAGCGASATARIPAASPTATSTPAPTPTATPPWTTLPTCGGTRPPTHVSDGGPQRLGDTDFVVEGPALTNLAYPGMQLHEDTPSGPLLLGTQSSLPYDSIDVNPNLQAGGGYDFFLCNGSPSRSHVVTSVSVRIESLTPFTGKLLEWPACQYAFTQGSRGGGGCGGGNEYDERVVASFPADAPAGTVTLATFQSSGSVNGEDPNLPPYGPLPAAVGPGHGMSVNVGLQMTAPSATYTFSFGVSFDGAPPVFSRPTRPVLLAPVAQTWTGPACTAPAMQAQIPPATNPPTYYICPES